MNFEKVLNHYNIVVELLDRSKNNFDENSVWAQYDKELLRDLMKNKPIQKNTVLTYVDDLKLSLREKTFLELFALFENKLYKQLNSNIKGLNFMFDKFFNAEHTLHNGTKAFIKSTNSDLQYVSSIKNLLVEKFGQENSMVKNFGAVIVYRNYLTHGKRISPIPTPIELEEAIEIFTAVVSVFKRPTFISNNDN